MNQNQIIFLFVLSAFLAHPILKAQEPVSPNGKFTNVHGAKIYYEEYGEGEPLILLHGFGRTASDWQFFIPDLSKHYRVIAWDMRGHGRSTNPDTSVVFHHAVAAQDLLSLMDILKIEKAKVIGHSSGGIIILYAATMQPERFDAIVPISAQMYFSSQTREFIKENAKPESYYKFNDGEKLHGKLKGMLIANQFYNFHKLKGDPAITPDQLATIKARTLIIHGDNDFVPVAQAWEMFNSIPNAHLNIVPNGWHLPQNGPLNGADFLRRTLEFLKGDWNEGFSPK
ncbi:alpha/beta fold hydrolase [Constantimarinum furrinae]|uniref:Soluble epoxide hydrolase n=1 Tax=Constantimarinum furrinae TaxID=2562285 RepID=A0A7G8PUW9_9FLAO|nr:alpha/beta hydrolase [Constantimarinum furrinae]QNJ98135.1 soluble epoxide hydrolase [Constantimarinum furrinae]